MAEASRPAASPSGSAARCEPPDPASDAALPTLWSFRRCPYAIRARLAIATAGLEVAVREVNLQARPPELLEIWPPGTVPVLQQPDGSLLSESLALMTWALEQADPHDWLRRDRPGLDQTLPRQLIAALIAENDGPFKHHLDRFKYANRYGDQDREGHRQAALAILRSWNALLEAARLPAGGPWLLGSDSSLADWALLPFVRQFRLADPVGFAAAEGLGALRSWLQRFESGPQLALVMAPPHAFRQPWRSPRWLYHLALAHEWRQAQESGVYRRSTRGLGLEQVGFIHASHADQIAATFARFYADAGPVRLLSIDPDRLAAAGVVVKEEADAASGECFPHLYGALPCTAVLAAEPYRP